MDFKTKEKPIIVSKPYTTFQYICAFLRIGMGWQFLWAFFDKLLGLGFTTPPENAWIAGGSPTTGFLFFAVSGPFASFYNVLAGNALVDAFFMISLLLLGVTLISGIGVRIAGYGGAILMLLIFLALMPPENNPILDDHIIYAALLIGLASEKAGHYFGLGNWWAQTQLVQKYPILE